ncbi:MAG: hypothetical protein ABJB47_13630 [Actinomycetota bacterium]
MEITTRLAVRQLVSIAELAATAASQPGHGRRRTRITLAKVERGTLHYSVLAAGREIQSVRVRFEVDDEQMRVAVDGDQDAAAGAFVSDLSRRILSADPGSVTSPPARVSADPAG